MFDKKNKITFMIYFKTTYVFPPLGVLQKNSNVVEMSVNTQNS